MDINKAVSLLAVSENATENDIKQALSSKLTELASKKQAAPTDALKEKFDAIIAQHQQAAEFLLKQASDANQASGTTQAPKKPSALSQTQIDDLPGFATNDTAHVELQPGTILANRYEIKELIGQGGMGVVYRAFDKNRDEDIAIKLLLPSLTKNERALERFLNEARISSKLSHPNIVNVFDVQNDTAGQGDLYFLTMELLEGQDLAQLIEIREQLAQPFSQKELLELMQQVAPALEYAHIHTVHRDIKPENIWLDEDGNYKIMDFGIAQLQSTSQRTQTGAAMGTAYYMAPEQLKGSKSIDGRTDIYALGVMLYAMATGSVPAGLIKPLNEKRPDLDAGFCDAAMQCLEAEPEDRPGTPLELLERLQQTSNKKGAKNKNSNNSVATTINYTPIIIMILLVIAVFGGVQFNNHLQEQNRLQIKEEQRIAAKRIEEQRIAEAKRKEAKRKSAAKVKAAKAKAARLKAAKIAKTKAKKLIGKLVSIPAGSFRMGDIQGAGASDEKPVHRVSLKAFNMMAAEVTFTQWDACVRAGGCSYKPNDKGWGRGNRAVMNVSYNDITQQFIPWLNKATGAKGNNKFRLPSEAEWEYAARAGSSTKYSWGNSIGSGRANCDGCSSQWDNSKTAPVKSFSANQWGLYDMHGNVWEWTQDCWNDSYNGAPANGNAWQNGNCAKRVLRGGSWFSRPNSLRSALRDRGGSASRGNKSGFRLVQGR